MSNKVLVIELPEDADLAMTLQAVKSVIGDLLGECHVYAAIREDAAAILRVFEGAS